MKEAFSPICKTYMSSICRNPGMYSTWGFYREINLYTVQYPGHGDGREIKVLCRRSWCAISQ